MMGGVYWIGEKGGQRAEERWFTQPPSSRKGKRKSWYSRTKKCRRPKIIEVGHIKSPV